MRVPCGNKKQKDVRMWLGAISCDKIKHHKNDDNNSKDYTEMRRISNTNNTPRIHTPPVSDCTGLLHSMEGQKGRCTLNPRNNHRRQHKFGRGPRIL